MKVFLIIFLVLLLLIPLILGLYLIIFNHYYKKYFSRHGKFLKSQNKKFLKELNDSQTSIFSDFSPLHCENGDIKLNGIYKNNGKNKLAILAHSFGQDHRSLSKQSEFFLQEGFDVLVIDLRGHGKSEGESSLGVYEAKDIVVWVNKSLDLNPNYNIVLYGVGLGASSQLLSLPNLPNSVRLAISESGFDSGKKQLSFLMSKDKIRLPFKSFFNYLKRTQFIPIQNTDCVESLKKSKVKVIIMHDENDEIVPLEMAYSLQENQSKKEENFIIFPECLHGEAIEKQPYKFKTNLSKLLKRNGF